MTTPHEKPLAAEDITNKVRGDLQAMFANVAKNAKNTSAAPSTADDPAKQSGEQKTGSTDATK